MKDPFEYVALIVEHEKKNTRRVLRDMKRSNNYLTKNKGLLFIADVPHFRYKDEWICFPAREDNGFYDFYDYVEETPIYKEAKPIIEEIIKKELGCIYGKFGSCHEIWEMRKELLLEKYDIEWFSPAELNITMNYD